MHFGKLKRLTIYLQYLNFILSSSSLLRRHGIHRNLFENEQLPVSIPTAEVDISVKPHSKINA